jgi:hypothetical protein
MGDQMTSQGSNELVTILGNIDSLLNEIKQALGINAGAGEETNKAVVEENPKDKENQGSEQEMQPANKSKLKKAVLETPSEGTTASDDAEKRQEEDASKVSTDNVKDLEKSLIMTLKSFLNKNENKPNVTKDNGNNKILSDMSEVLKQLALNQSEIQKKQNDTDLAIMNVLKGLKIADEVEKSIVDTEKNKVQKGFTNSVDNEKMAKFVKSLIDVNKDDNEPTNFTAQGRNDSIQKSLHNVDILKALIGNPSK